jgi:nucleoside-diphosphate-sugar epimerase
MTVLVTGAAGFIGRHLVASLLAEGKSVVGVDNFITSDRGDLGRLLGEPGFTFEELDITAPEFRALGARLDVEAIYNLACPTGVPNLGPLALEMLETCYEGSKAVLDIARAQGASALLTSTAEVYGNPLVSPQDEDYTGNVETLGPRKGYEEGKRVAETLFGVYAEKYGVQAKVVRVFNTYGPGMCLTDTRIIPTFLTAALAAKPLPVHGEGQQTRCHCYVSDMVAGIRLAMAKAVPARAYNLGSQKQVTVKALADMVNELTGSTSGIRTIERPRHDHDNRLPDTTRAREELGWVRQVELEEGLRATIADFRERLASAAGVAA